MADQEIVILIKAVDEISATLKNVESEVTQMGSNVQKSTQSLGTSFQQTTTSLISLGNAAASVDNIFSSYTNLQLRLENASERVLNAQDRLSDAQTKLNRLMEDGTATIQDIQDAQKEMERATRNLTISQNNQERAQNAVIGTYISMGVQVISLIGALPGLITAIRTLTISTAILESITAPAVLVLGLLAAAAAIATINYLEQDKATTQLTKSTYNAGQATNVYAKYQNQMSKEVDLVNDKMSRQVTILHDTIDAMRVLTASEKEQMRGGSSPYGINVSTGEQVLVPSSRPFGDFISRPGQSATTFSPNDTIIGVSDPKSLGGNTINVRIDSIYGLNATEVSRALKRELGAKLSI